jgi:hypothetical protein
MTAILVRNNASWLSTTSIGAAAQSIPSPLGSSTVNARHRRPSCSTVSRPG